MDRESMGTRFPGVFAIGDNTSTLWRWACHCPRPAWLPTAKPRPWPAIADRINGKGRDGTFDGHRVCFVETRGGRAGFGGSDFYGHPLAQVKFHEPSRKWHMVKVLIEKRWMKRWL